LEVKVGGKLSEKKEREKKRVCGGFGVLLTVYGKAKGKQNGSRLQGLCENDRNAMQACDR
jgi:hypothetical protein